MNPLAAPQLAAFRAALTDQQPADAVVHVDERSAHQAIAELRAIRDVSDTDKREASSALLASPDYQLDAAARGLFEAFSTGELVASVQNAFSTFDDFGTIGSSPDAGVLRMGPLVMNASAVIASQDASQDDAPEIRLPAGAEGPRGPVDLDELRRRGNTPTSPDDDPEPDLW